jgi:uncharacterized protein YndB with AHSA1/START domain
MSEQRITISTVVAKPIEQVWHVWTTPAHIMQWNAASDDWHTPQASVDLRVGGKFSSIMAAKDGSFSFDFHGVYDEVIVNQKISYTIEGGRKVEVLFEETANGVKVTERFEPEQENSLELQHAGWQAILDSFQRYCLQN